MVMKIDVKVDNTRCINPLECGKCMRVCPTMAFKTYPPEVRKKGVNYDKWLLDCLSFECIGCGKCEEVCEAGAVKVVIA